MVDLFLLAVSPAEPTRKHRSPCVIIYPSDATLEWECRTLYAGELLEKLFGEHWIGIGSMWRSSIGSIDVMHRLAGPSNSPIVLLHR